MIDSDCASDRACESGFCVVSERVGTDAGNQVVDSTPEPDGPPPPPDADPFEAIKAQCLAVGYTTVAGTTSLFKNVTTSRTWTVAQADCKDDVPGATHLAVLSNDAERIHVTAQAQRGWIGLLDNATNVFVTVTGETGDLRPFDDGQPDNGSGNENCIQSRTDNGLLDDDQCNENHRYVCECDGKPSTP